MTARMDATREALAGGPFQPRPYPMLAAALAEVEEWEARLSEADDLRGDDYILASTHDAIVGRIFARAEAAEAERDSLREALLVARQYVHAEYGTGNWHEVLERDQKMISEVLGEES